MWGPNFCLLTVRCHCAVDARRFVALLQRGLCVSVELFSALSMGWMINIDECSKMLPVAMCFVYFPESDPFMFFVQVAGASEEYYSVG